MSLFRCFSLSILTSAYTFLKSNIDFFGLLWLAAYTGVVVFPNKANNMYFRCQAGWWHLSTFLKVGEHIYDGEEKAARWLSPVGRAAFLCHGWCWGFFSGTWAPSSVSFPGVFIPFEECVLFYLFILIY